MDIPLFQLKSGSVCTSFQILTRLWLYSGQLAAHRITWLDWPFGAIYEENEQSEVLDRKLNSMAVIWPVPWSSLALAAHAEETACGGTWYHQQLQICVWLQLVMHFPKTQMNISVPHVIFQATLFPDKICLPRMSKKLTQQESTHMNFSVYAALLVTSSWKIWLGAVVKTKQILAVIRRLWERIIHTNKAISQGS